MGELISYKWVGWDGMEWVLLDKPLQLIAYP